jgi:hypothetical protein
MMANTWATALDPVIANPLVQGQLLTNVALANGTTIVNHKLGRKLIGWLIVGINGAATVYDNQASNQMPQLTLSLTSNAAVTANIWVF